MNVVFKWQQANIEHGNLHLLLGHLQQPRRGRRSHGFWEPFLTQTGLSAV